MAETHKADKRLRLRDDSLGLRTGKQIAADQRHVVLCIMHLRVRDKACLAQ
jgi:hypothetical protein